MNTRVFWQRYWLWLGLYLALVVFKKSFLVSYELLWWVLGGVASMVFEWIDRWVYVFVTRPHEQLSVQVGELIKGGRWVEGWKLLLARRDEQTQLISFSGLFLIAWLFLAIFVLTSTTNFFAKGLVMAVGWRVVYEWIMLWGDWDSIKRQVYWQIKREVPLGEVKWVVGIFIGIFGIISLLL